MRKDVFGALRLLAVPTLGLLGIALFAPGQLALGVRVYALILCAAVIVVLLSALGRAYPSETPLGETKARLRRVAAPPSVTRLENEVALGVAGSFDLHFRLVPRLRFIAAGLLTSRRNVSLDADPEAARALLGTNAWELVRRDRPTPTDRLTKGIAERELGRVVDALEGV